MIIFIMNIELRGDGYYFNDIIQIRKPLNPKTTIIRLYTMLINSLQNEKFKSNMFYIYIMMSDLSCGFIPLPSQTLEEIGNIFGKNLVITISPKPIYG